MVPSFSVFTKSVFRSVFSQNGLVDKGQQQGSYWCCKCIYKNGITALEHHYEKCIRFTEERLYWEIK